MVSVHPNPPPGHGFTRFYGCYTGGDPMDTKRAENDGSAETSYGLVDPSKKVRKPYTITKSRESWSEQEHDKFLEALHLFDRDWKKIEAFVGSKTVIQIRSHAQKYFLKVQKNGTTEHVPPPRPKRKAARPYPQKAPKYDDFGSSGVSMKHSSGETSPSVWTNNETNRRVKEKLDKEDRVTPDFAQVYSFIGSVFDPSASDHLQRLKKMDPVNLETALILMKNLSVNLVSPESESHRRLLSSFGAGIKNGSIGSEITA